MLQDLKIFEKTYELILWIYPAVNKFPKTQRFVLGQQIENTTLNLLKLIIQANAARPPASSLAGEVGRERSKLPYLKQASVELDKLRILIRLAKDLKFFSIKRYEFASGKINEIGKMLGGWIRQQDGLVKNNK